MACRGSDFIPFKCMLEILEKCTFVKANTLEHKVEMIAQLIGTNWVFKSNEEHWKLYDSTRPIWIIISIAIATMQTSMFTIKTLNIIIAY